MATRALAAATTASVARGGAPSSSAPAARRRRDRVVRAEGERRASVAARAWGPRPRRGGGGGGGGWTTTTTPKSLRNGVHHANAVVWEPVTTTTRRRATPEDDARAGASAAAASSSSSSPPDDDDDDDEALDEALDLPVPVIVECAMLSALTSLLFHFANLLRVDAWFGALYPMPVIIAAARHGDRAGRRVMWVSTLLLFVISGVLRSTNYFFLHGAMAYALGFLWNRGKSWWWTIPIASIARCAGIFGSLTFSSLLLRENVMQLLVVQMYGLLDQIAANVGASFMPSIQWIWAIAVVFVFFNSFVYVAILHSVYTIVLRIVIPDKPDYVRAPERMKKILLAQQPEADARWAAGAGGGGAR